MYRVNPQTGQIEDENGNPVGAAPLDQVQGAPPSPGPGPMASPPAPPSLNLAANQISGRNVNEPLVLDRRSDEEKAGGGVQPAPMEQPSTPIAPVQPPGMVKNLSQTTTTKTRELPTVEEARARDAYESAVEQEGEALKQQGEAEGKQSTAKGKGTAAEAAAGEAHANALKQEAARQDAEIAKAKATFAAEQDKYSKMEIKDMYEGRPGLVVANAVAAALGAIGAALSRGPNTALQIIEGNERQWYARQRAAIEKQKDIVGIAKEGVETARQAKQDAINDLNIQAAARLDALAKKTLAAGEMAGSDVARARAQSLASALQTRAQEKGVDAAIGLRTKISTSSEVQKVAGTGTGAAGEGRGIGVQTQKAQLAEKGQDAIDTVMRLNKKGVFLTDADRRQLQKNEKGMETMAHAGPLAAMIGRATVFPVSRYEGLSPEKQELAQANEILTQIAAAVTSPSTAEGEIKHGRDVFDLNGPGISEVARARMFNNIRGIVGAAGALGGARTAIAQQGAAAARGTPAPTAPTGGKQGGQMKLVNGRKAIVHPDGSYDWAD